MDDLASTADWRGEHLISARPAGHSEVQPVIAVRTVLPTKASDLCLSIIRQMQPGECITTLEMQDALMSSRGTAATGLSVLRRLGVVDLVGIRQNSRWVVR